MSEPLPMWGAVLRGRNGVLVAAAGETFRYLKRDARWAAELYFGYDDWRLAMARGWRVERIGVSLRAARKRK